MARDILGELGLDAPLTSTTGQPQGEPKDIMTELGYKARMPMPLESAGPRDVLKELGLDQEPQPEPPLEGFLTPEMLEKMQKGQNILSAPLDAAADFAGGMVKAPVAGLAGLGSLLLPSDSQEPDAKVGRATDVIKSVMDFGSSNNPYAAKVLHPLEQGLDKTIGAAGRFAGGTALREMQAGGASPETAAGVAAVTEGITQLAGWMLGAKAIKSGWNSTPIRNLRVRERGLTTADSNRPAGKSKFDVLREQHPDLSLGAFLRKYPEFKQQEFAARATPENNVRTEAATEAPKTGAPKSTKSTTAPDAKMEAFFKAVDEFKGFENIPDGHPSIIGLKASEQLKYVNAYEKAQKGEAKSKGTKEPGKKMTFKEKIAEDVKKFKTVEEVEAFYAGKKHASLAKKLWLEKDKPVETKEAPSGNVTPLAEVLKGEVLPDDLPAAAKVQEAPVAEVTPTEVSPRDEGVAVEPELTEEMKAQLREEILGKEEVEVPRYNTYDEAGKEFQVNAYPFDKLSDAKRVAKNKGSQLVQIGDVYHLATTKPDTRLNQKRLEKKIKEGGGIAAGEPYDLLDDGSIIDKFGRTLETINDYNTRIALENDSWKKIEGKKVTKDILDPITEDVIIKKGSTLDAESRGIIEEAGLAFEGLLRNDYLSDGLKIVSANKVPTKTPPVDDASLRPKIEHSGDVTTVEPVVEQPKPEATPEGAKIFDSLELAEEDYRILPRNYTSYEQASKALELKGGGFEVILVGDKYKLGKDWLDDEVAEVDFDKLNSALADIAKPIEDAPVSAAKKEIIKVEKFTEVGDSWIGQVGDGRAVGIIKGEKQGYEAYLGTPEEIQSGTAELVGSFPSLPKARAAFKSGGKEVKKADKMDAHELAQAIRAKRQLVEDLREEARQGELERLMKEQEEDLLGDENMESWEELAEKEAMQDYDEEGYFDQRDLKDTFDDVLTLFGDDRGAINPKAKPEIMAAKRRLAQDVKKLASAVKGMGAKLKGTRHEPLEEVVEAAEIVREANSTWQKVKDFARSEEGSLNVSQLLSELAVKIKRAYEAVKAAGKAVKDYLLSKRGTNPYARYGAKDQGYLQKTILHTLDQSVKALRTDSHLANIELFNFMKDQKRIVPEHDGVSFTPPERQRPMIRADVTPELKPGVTTLAPHIMGKQQSPSNIFKQLFEPEHNPVIDYMESTMAHFFNEKNDGRFVKTILKEFKDDSVNIRREFDALYEPLRALVRSKQVGDKKINTWTNTLSVTQDFGKKRDLKAKIELEKKKQSARAQKIQNELTQTYDNAIGDLARKYPTVRIGLQAGQVLPEGIQLSPVEMKAAEAMREYFDQSALDLKRVGVPIIQEDGRTYMHRILPEILNDPDSQGFLSDQKVPTVMKFMHQSVDGRLWYPDAHTIFSNYVPVANRKIAFQPFLNRWRQTMDEVPQDISEYFTEWLSKNLLAQPRGQTHKIIDGVIAFEYLRLIGGSLSVAFKHATKAADTLARFDAITDVKALNSTLRAIGQAGAKALGVKGEYAELSMMKAFVTSRAMVRMLDETPGMSSLAYYTKALAGLPTTTVETLDNGVTIFATILAANSNGQFTPEQTTKIIWETVMAANFRGGADQPLFYKNVGGRVFGMFQSTPWKLLEYRMDIIRGAARGEVDHFGTSYGSILVRYLMLMGMAEGIARSFGNSLLDLWLHFPFVSHFVKSTSKPPFVQPAVPSASGSPVAEWIIQMKNKDIYHGTKEHLIYWGLPSRLYAMNTSKYPTNYYNSPMSHLFGIKKEDTPHGKGPLKSNGSRSGRSGRSGRSSR